ncbi:MAG: T9SS type A sorting domain-containing protein [Saprospirales bacterium]|nr:T9SS type A sorting domain-containing protein [Saprospirales bacterium]
MESKNGCHLLLESFEDLEDPRSAHWGWLIKVDQNGCMDTLDCKLSGNAVVHDLGKPGPRVYPNPVSSALYFSDAGGTGWDRIDICNTLGQTVLTVRQPAGHQLDVSALPAGLYWVRFYAAGRSWVRPVVKR